MTVESLSERQLFRMKRANLEKRINHYYSETQDTDSVIEYGVAILVFNAITMTNYSFICKELFKQIFLTSEPTDKLREYCLYFYDYFEFNEWEIVRDRLFKNRAEFSERTREIRPETKYLRAASVATNKKLDWLYENYLDDGQRALAVKERYNYAFKIVFLDENGKKHKQTFKNADVSMPHTQLKTLLEILTRLTIFEKNGVRRFYEIVFPECETSVGRRHFADAAADAAYLERKRQEAETQ